MGKKGLIFLALGCMLAAFLQVGCVKCGCGDARCDGRTPGTDFTDSNGLLATCEADDSTICPYPMFDETERPCDYHNYICGSSSTCGSALQCEGKRVGEECGSRGTCTLVEKIGSFQACCGCSS